MLWLALYFPHFALELCQLDASSVIAITAKKGSRRWLVACSPAAREAGLHRGLDVATALARVPTLKLVERSKSSERNAMKAIAAWAEQYSSTVCFDAHRWITWIEIGASLAYFGGLDAMLQHIHDNIETLRYTTQQGVAPTIEGAALLAMPPQAPVVQTRAALIEAISSLSLQYLFASAETIDALRSVGWNCIGDALAIPRDQLSRRFGREFTHHIQKLLGEQSDPREPFRAPATYRRRFDFSEPVYTVEALLFPLRRMLGELQGYLRGRDTALQRLTVELRHHKQASTIIELRTTAPQRDSSRLLALLREQLDRTPLTSPVTELVLAVDQFVSPGDTQQDFFSTTSRRQNDWVDLLDKFRARLGDQAVRRLGLSNDHRPEKAWCLVHQEKAQESLVTVDANAEESERPFWLLNPTPLRHLPKLLGKPERIEAGWWSGDDCRRDYYVAKTTEGSRWWLYKDAKTSQWFLHGVWS